MSSSNILRLLIDALRGGETIDMGSSDTLKLNPKSWGTSKYVQLDAGNDRIQFDGVDQLFGDDDSLIFGDGSDIKVAWDGTRLTAGPASGFWAGCPSGLNPDPTSHFEIFDDFTELGVGSTTSPWTAGTNTNGAIALGLAETSNTPGRGGYVTLSTDGTLQYDFATMKMTSATTGAPFYIVEDSGKKLWYETKIMVSSVTDKFYMMGLGSPAADDVTADSTGLEAIQDGFYFRTLLATETQIDTETNQNTTGTEIGGNTGTLAANTAITLGMYFDGVTTLTFYINRVAQADVVTIGDDGNIPNDVGLTPFFHVKDGVGAGSASALHIDYIKCVQLL